MNLRQYDSLDARQTLDQCRADDIRLRVINGALRKIIPPGKAIAPELQQAIRRNEAELITILASRSGLASVPANVDPETGEVLEDLPQIDAGNKDIPDVTQHAWGALAAANEPPHLFRHAGAMSRLETEDGRAVMRPLTDKRLSYELARAADWFIPKKSGPEPAVPPLHVVNDLLATPEPPLPIVERMTHAPYFAPDGRLVTMPGYDEASRTILFLDGALHLQTVPDRPTDADVAKARTLILDELYADFPFVADADRANAVALFLLPYVRQMIAGPTPNHLIEAPGAGSGKGLLAEVAMRPAVGMQIGVITGARDDDEWRKRISAKLREAAPVVLLDNITRALDSGALASALTAYIWSDRILGTNETMNVPVRCVWITTANNPTMTTEIARRTIRIRLDPKQDRPWQRTEFRHKNLVAWADSRRADLIHAALVLIQAWIAAGRREAAITLGSYERWAAIMGGILDTAGVKGFLDNLDEFYEAADLEGAIWRQFVTIWWAEHKDTEVGAKDLFNLADQVEGFDFGKGNLKAQQTSFGMQLAKQRDRVIGEYRIVLSGVKQRLKQWRLIPTTIGTLVPPDEGGTADLREKGTPPVSPCDTKGNGKGGVPLCTNLNPYIENEDSPRPRMFGERYTEVHQSTDEALRAKGKQEVYLSSEGTPTDEDRAMCLSYLRSGRASLTVDEIETARRFLGYPPYSAMATDFRARLAEACSIELPPLINSAVGPNMTTRDIPPESDEGDLHEKGPPIPLKLLEWARTVLGDDWPDGEPPAWVVTAAGECGLAADSVSERATAQAIIEAAGK